MKRFLSILPALVMVLSLVACGNKTKIHDFYKSLSAVA